jgi:hypothetical protein
MLITIRQVMQGPWQVSPFAADGGRQRLLRDAATRRFGGIWYV